MRRLNFRGSVLWIVLAVQGFCSLFFIWGIAESLLGIRREPIAWEYRELIEIGAAVGLLIGFVVVAAFLRATVRRHRALEEKLRRASGAFAELLEERFKEWGLTPSERDVAWFTLKGLAIADIARMRQTSEGTVKAQSNAIYRKAGVNGRTQLVTLFIEDLMEAGPRQDPPRVVASG